MSASETYRAAQLAAKAERIATSHLKNIEIGKRSIRLFVSPAPVNFAERRSVLRALEQYGQGQGSAFISLMKESEAATRAVSSSPVNITVPSSCKEPRSVVKVDGLKPHFEKQPSQSSNDTKFFIEITESPAYNHKGSSSSFLASVWPDFVTENKTLASKTLQQSLPNSIAARGLSQWAVDFGREPTMDSRKIDRVQTRNWVPTKIKTPPRAPISQAVGEWERRKRMQRRREPNSKVDEQETRITSEDQDI
ncbi:uncharacterized protein FPRO_07869 [Fusarium proliferatum ET1]|uniref:Uncharacterized protein n=1 Tax=Fusarium proliferatum (strain ET1) TaxID=1227346 RepID=A0A1L7VU03_FUSPR|nr:uncharacterized protein FPRO_07869 [Fusarium proliferatum ET1]CVK89944.1 uncharacterized protein FPRN_07621 [Fusarium proliferatum]CZR43215.1 uncharacterized protein FPRO_07869 [Fusarium proliferatum ET1]